MGRVISVQTILALVAVTVISAGPVCAFDAAESTDRLGLALLRQAMERNGSENLVMSPFSIEESLGMAYVGSNGATRAAMGKILGLPDDDAAVARGLSSLEHPVGDASGILAVANRVYLQNGTPIRPGYRALLADGFHAPLQELDFAHDAEASREAINRWVGGETHQRISDLLPPGAIRPDERLMLVNAVYFYGRWRQPFEARETRPGPFHPLHGGAPALVPMMGQTGYKQYLKGDGFVAVGLPYRMPALQMIVILPDKGLGPAEIASRLTPGFFQEFAKGAGEHPERPDQRKRIALSMPKFTVHPRTMELSRLLKSLGMTAGFRDAPIPADFSRASQEPLVISDIFHQAMISVDELGTEAAAATGSALTLAVVMESPAIPVEVDRPFLFAIEDCTSGLCLFLGQVVAPAAGSTM